MIYTYLYKDPKTNVPIYIGKGTNERAWDHLVSKSHLGNLLRKRIREGYEIHPIINFEVDEQTALFMEEVWIEQYGRLDIKTGTLLNLTNGGEGTSGRKHTEETKRKIGEANAKSLLGHYPTQETIEKRRVGQTGKKRTDASKELMSQKALGKSKSDQHRAALSRAVKGKPWSEARRNAQLNKNNEE